MLINKKFWISPEKAVDVAIKSIGNCNLLEDPIIRLAIDFGDIGTPLFVEHLDFQEKSYYLIPWCIEKKLILIVEVDALHSTMNGATPLPEPISYFFITPEEAYELVSRKFPEKTFGKPQLVWRPCRESTNPLKPFYQIPFEKKVLYIGINGSIFTELTPFGRRK